MGSTTGGRAQVFGSEKTRKLVLTVQAGGEQQIHDMGLKNTAEVQQQFKKGWEGGLLGWG